MVPDLQHRFSELVDRHYGSVWACVSVLTARSADTEDLVHQAFLLAFERLADGGGFAGDAVAVGVSQRHDFWNGAELLVPAADIPALQEKWQAEAREHEAAQKRAGEHQPAVQGTEQEIKRLLEENARLRREIEELKKH